MVFDGFNNAIDVAADFLLITVFGDTDALVVIVGFVDYNEARRQLADKGNVSSGIIGSFVFREAVGDVLDAANAAVSSPLLETSISGARGVIINITSSPDIGLDDVEKAASLITNSAHPEANIIWGAAFDENLKDEMSITVIATGFDAGLVGSDPMDVPQNAAVFTGKVPPVAFKNDTAPVAPAQPVQPVQPVAPTQPVQPVAPTQPVQPAPAVEEDDNSYFDDILGLLNNRGNN